MTKVPLRRLPLPAPQVSPITFHFGAGWPRLGPTEEPHEKETEQFCPRFGDSKASHEKATCLFDIFRCSRTLDGDFRIMMGKGTIG
jgi:hypothetical protein